MTEGLKISFTVTGLSELLKRIPDKEKRERVAHNILDRYSLAIRREAQIRVPKRTGHTARSIANKVEGMTAYVGDFGEVGGSARTAAWLEKGTGIFGPRHERIYPKKGKVLRWPIGAVTLSGRHKSGAKGTFAFARSIKGMRAQPFLMPAFEGSEPFLAATLKQAESELFGKGT